MQLGCDETSRLSVETDLNEPPERKSKRSFDISAESSCGCKSNKIRMSLYDSLDVDIDSDNDDGFSKPDRNPHEDQIEDDSDRTGKRITVRDEDENKYVKLVVELPQVPNDVDNSQAEIAIRYDDNDPLSEEEETGNLRIWKEAVMSTSSEESVVEGGDYIPSTRGDEPYDPSILGFSNTTRQQVFLVEAVQPSEKLADERIEVKYSYSSEDNSHSTEDAVRATAIEFDFVDARAFNPKIYGAGTDIYDNEPILDGTNLHRNVKESMKMDGAVTDGAALVVMRMKPRLKNQNLKIEITEKNGDSQDPLKVGSLFNLKEHFDLDALSLPPVPALDRTQISNRSSGPFSSPENVKLQTEVDFVDGSVVYRPPVSFLFGNRNTEAGKIEVNVKKGGSVIHDEEFILRRPPILMVHGIIGSPETYPENIWKSNRKPFNTVLRKVDYFETSLTGVPENASVVPDNLSKLRSNYRSGSTTTLTDWLKGKRFAITRADVIAHSQGGMLTTFYIANMSDVDIKLRENEEGWTARFPTMDPKYLRSTNYQAGDIRSFISLGTPYLGTPIADEAEPAMDGNEWTVGIQAGCNLAKILRGQEDDLQKEFGDLRDALVKEQSCTPRSLATAYDFQTSGSDLLRALKQAKFPSGRKGVRWHPIVGILSKEIDEDIFNNPLWRLFYGENFSFNISPVEVDPEEAFDEVKDTDFVSGFESQSLGEAERPFKSFSGYPRVFDDHLHCCVSDSLDLKDEPTSKEIRATIKRLLGDRTISDDFFKPLIFEE